MTLRMAIQPKQYDTNLTVVREKSHAVNSCKRAFNLYFTLMKYIVKILFRCIETYPPTYFLEKALRRTQRADKVEKKKKKKNAIALKT